MKSCVVRLSDTPTKPQQSLSVCCLIEKYESVTEVSGDIKIEVMMKLNSTEDDVNLS